MSLRPRWVYGRLSFTYVCMYVHAYILWRNEDDAFSCTGIISCKEEKGESVKLY